MSQFTPQFKLRTSFSTIKLSSITSPRLKPKKTLMLTTACIYEFECPCQKTYIGETKRILWERIKEHRTDKKSHIFKHYKTCPVYNQKFFEKYNVDPDNAPDNILRDFIKDKFTVLEKNLNHTSFRKTFEGLLITLKKPELNIQKSHKCQTFLCTCVIPDDSIT